MRRWPGLASKSLVALGPWAGVRAPCGAWSGWRTLAAPIQGIAALRSGGRLRPAWRRKLATGAMAVLGEVTCWCLPDTVNFKSSSGWITYARASLDRSCDDC